MGFFSNVDAMLRERSRSVVAGVAFPWSAVAISSLGFGPAPQKCSAPRQMHASSTDAPVDADIPRLATCLQVPQAGHICDSKTVIPERASVCHELDTKIAVLQSMRTSLARLVSTCDRPRPKRDCPLLASRQTPDECNRLP